MRYIAKNSYLLMVVALSAIIIVGCKNPIKNEQIVDLPEEFESFYSRFHQDSIYQIDHIVFPLSGKPVMMKRDTSFFEWPREEWIMHKPFDVSNREFSRQIESIDENIIEEKIQHKTTGFGMKRRFAKVGKEWMLIHYVGMNASEFID